jgi:hypothetical protein
LDFIGGNLGKLIDLTGQRFGRLTVIKRAKRPGSAKTGTYWECLCDCGNISVTCGAGLVRGDVKSCGCYNKERVRETHFIDRTEQKFKRLLIIELDHIDKKHGSCWKCLCDCGNEIIVQGNNLVSGVTQSCGCLHKERITLTKGLSALNKIFDSYKRKAKNRDINFELDKDFFIEIINKNCFYCGSKPTNLQKNPKGNGDYIYNGIDRINSLLGYIKENVVPCCGRCNIAKKNFSQSDFLLWIEKIYNYSIKNKGYN